MKDEIIKQQDKIIKMLTQSNNSLLDRVKEHNSILLELKSLTRFKKHSTNINHSLKQENEELRLRVMDLIDQLNCKVKNEVSELVESLDIKA